MEANTYDRWQGFKNLINVWRSPLTENDGMSDAEIVESEQSLGFRLPLALRELYQLVGNRDDVFGALSMQSWTVVDDVFVFCEDEMFLVLWGIRVSDLHLADPPVVTVIAEIAEHPDNWILDSNSVSVFTLKMHVFDLLHSTDFVADSSITKAQAELIAQNYPRYPELDERNAQLFGDADTLILLRNTEWLWAIARNEEAQQRLQRIIWILWFKRVANYIVHYIDIEWLFGYDDMSKEFLSQHINNPLPIYTTDKEDDDIPF